MNVLFVDIDGVLNQDPRGEAGPYKLHPEAVAALNHIVEATGAWLVISSDWRRFLWLQLPQIFANNGVKGRILGRTPHLPGQPRGAEIGQWLFSMAGQEIRFVILDDSTEMGTLYRYLVHTEPSVGLTQADAARAIRLLRSWDRLSVELGS